MRFGKIGDDSLFLGAYAEDENGDYHINGRRYRRVGPPITGGKIYVFGGKKDNPQ